MKKHIKTSHGIALFTAFLFLTLVVITYTTKQLDVITKYIPTIEPHTQLSAVADFNSNLVAHYTFDEGSGTTAGDSAGSNTGTLMGGPVWTTTDKKVGSGALGFDGTNDRVAFGTEFIGTGAKTFSAWINVNNFSEASIVENRKSVFEIYSIGTSGVIRYSGDGNVANAVSATGAITTNKWYFVVATHDASGVANIYVDGVLSGTANQNSGTPIAGTTNVQIGGSVYTSRLVNGSIDDVRIYSRALTASEVAQLYSSTEGTVTTPVNSTCGPAAKSYTSLESFPAGAYCMSGTANPSSPSNPAQGSSSTWSCEGTTTASCTASRAIASTDTIAPIITTQTIHYIRAGATGNNDGSDWNNAWRSFGAVTWIRGHTYYVAGGAYAENVGISVAESGTSRIILKKANVSDNSSDVGWNSVYETTQALVRGTFNISSSHITIDGVTGYGSNGFGIKIYGSSTGVGNGNAIINLADGKSFITITHLEIEGPGMGVLNGVSGLKQNNTTTPSKGIVLSNLYLHDLSQNGSVFVNVIGTSFSDYGLLYENVTLSDCGYNTIGGHGQGIQGGSGASPSSNSYWIIRNSIFHNIIGTAAVAFLGYSQNDHIDIYNNIFYNQNKSFDTDWIDYVTLKDAFSPGVIYFSSTNSSADRVRVYNNTFDNINRNTIYFAGSSTNNEAINNLFTRGYFNIRHVGVIGSYNDYYNNIPLITSGIYGVPYGEIGQQGESSSPVIDASSGDFRLRNGANAIGKGFNLSSVFTTDITGNPRGSTWDIGAYEYTGAVTIPSTYSVTITKSGTGTGTLTATGLSCTGNTCTATVNIGSSLVLTATPSTGSTFTGWSNGCTGVSTCTLNSAASPIATFTSTGAPVISNIQASSITSSSANISWTTNESTLNKVQYGLSTAYSSVTAESALTTSPSFTLSSLAPNTTYHYRVISTDVAGNVSTSLNGTFPTPPNPVSDDTDIDDDEVLNVNDKCGLTPLGVTVNSYGCPLPRINNFTLKPTTSGDLNSSSFDLGTTYGKISFINTPLVKRDGNYLDVDSYLTIAQSLITLNSTLLSELNRPAVITLYNINLTTPKILKDGIVCSSSVCTNVTYNASTKILSFNVSSFSIYAIIEGTDPTPSTNVITVSPSGSGTGIVSATGISCGSDCSGTVTSGNSITLSAIASSGSTFTGWSGGYCSGTGVCTFSPTQDSTVVATFTIIASVSSGSRNTPPPNVLGGNNSLTVIPGCDNRTTGFSTTNGRSCVGNIGTALNTSALTGSSTYNFGTVTLRNGSRGLAVMELQRFLNAKLNLGLVIDGKLGPKTIAVIKKWQLDNGLVADGLVGAKTKARMNSR